MNSTLIKADYQSLIFEFRGHKVMLDSDLATLYQIETKQLRTPRPTSACRWR